MDKKWARTDEERAVAFGTFLEDVFTLNEDYHHEEHNNNIVSYIKSDLQLSLPVKSCNPKEVSRIIKT